MQKSKITLFAFLTMVAMMFSSCLGNGEERYSITYNYTECFNVVTDLLTGQQSVRVSPAYQIELNLTDATADITMSNISLPGVSGALSFKLQGLKFRVDNKGNYDISGVNITPAGGAAGYYTFTTLSIKFVDRQLNESNRIPVYYINYTINSTTRVNVVGTNNYYFGETKVSSKTDTEATPYTTNETYYGVVLDPQSMQASVNFYSAKFAAAMPVSLNFTLRNLPFTVTADGYNINVEGATTPYLNNTNPNPNFNIVDFSLKGISYTGATIEFDCSPAGVGDFHVVAPLEWLIYRPTPEQ